MRCLNPSVWWIHIGSYGGSGWCVCDEHRPLVLAKAGKDMKTSCSPLTSYSAVLTTVAGEHENRKQCQWEPHRHEGIKNETYKSESHVRPIVVGPMTTLMLTTPEANGRTCVYVRLIDGKLEFDGGQSIIRSQQGTGTSERVLSQADLDNLARSDR
jgi:hypothetical protein